jgi:DNA-binding LytR/AlgR family response regulator
MPVRDQARRAAAPDGAAGLFARLPPELGRDIIAVQAQDHYVKVFTPLGSRLVLMRMSDASDDLGGLNGMQIHRSWWVNIGHVLSLEKPAGSGPRLTLRNGITVPVPRSRVVAVRRALAARQAI